MSSLKPSGLKAPSRIAKPGAVAAKSSAVTAPTVKTATEKPAPAPPSETTEEFVDDFHVGERVWVNGNKPGCIQFLGETQFAPGQWAGIVLDEVIGKNDGAVAGVRYFQCEALRGIFTRPSKLLRKPLEEESNGTQTAPVSRSTSPTSVSCTNTSPVVTTAPASVVTPLKSSTPSAKESSTPAQLSNLTRTTSESISNLSETGSVKKERELKLGDRVLVSGSKAGVIRFLGDTDFAKGEWCGVELDEPLGKNDGAVAGTRYFQCQPKYGLFAPVHKVTRIGFPSTTPAKAKTSVRKIATMPTTPASLKRSPSASSISSLSSISSSVSNKPSRTGLLTETSSRYARKISGTTALQEALKEKQQHIEQLMAERDMERAEVAKATSQVGEVEQELTVIRHGHDQYVEEMEAKMDQLRALVEAADREKVELLNQLEEEKRRVEDLQFRVEEESITMGDLEAKTRPVSLKVATVSEKSHIMELEKDLALKTKEVADLRQRHIDSDKQAGNVDTSLSLLQEVNSLQESIATMTKEHNRELDSLKNKLKHTEENHAKEIGALKISTEKISKDNETLRVKLNHANKENSDVIELWKSKLERAINSNQEAMGELTLSFNKGTSAENSALIEFKAQIENLKLEHQKEMDRQKSAQDKELAVHLNEIEGLKTKLQEFNEEKEMELETMKSKLETAEEQHLIEMEDTLSKLHDTEIKANDLAKELLEQTEKLSLSEQKLNSFVQIKESWEKEIEDLKKGLNNSSESANLLQKTLQETVNNLEQKEKQYEEMSKELDLLKPRFVSLEKLLKESEVKEQNFLSTKTKLEKQISEMIQSSGDSSAQLTNLNEELQSRERNLDELRAEHSKARDLVHELEENIALVKAEATRNYEEAQKYHQEEVEKMTSQLGDLKLEIEKNQTENKELQKNHDKITADLNTQHQALVGTLKQNIQEKEDLWKTAQATISDMKVQMEDLKQQTEQIQVCQMAEETLQIVEKVTAEKNKFVKEKEEAVNEMEALKILNQKLQKELKDLSQEYNTYSKENTRNAELVKSECLKTETLMKEMGELRLLAEQKSQHLAALQEENLKLADELGKSKEEVTTNQKLEEERSVLNNQLLEMKKRDSLTKKEFDKEKASLQKSLNVTSALITEKDKELERLRNEVSELREKNKSARSLQSELRSLESEKINLEERVKNLEKELNDNKRQLNNVSNSSGDSSFNSQFQEEKTSLESQIEFLNSVIVDLQRNNDDLKLKIEKMIEASLNGNNEEEMDNHESLNGTQGKKKVPPRLFCDICDCFDLHDTEDCPTQTQLPDSPPHSTFHGSRKEERPYCDICEVFGHWTSSCNDDETF